MTQQNGTVAGSRAQARALPCPRPLGINAPCTNLSSRAAPRWGARLAAGGAEAGKEHRRGSDAGVPAGPEIDPLRLPADAAAMRKERRWRRTRKARRSAGEVTGG